ncbi:MAG: hypothetical protein ABIO61_01960 [Thermomonas sp.]
MSSRNESCTGNTLFNTIGTASANVIAARMLAFSNPATVLSPWHQSEARRMTSEKLDAASEGMREASVELAMLPSRLLMISATPSAWTPSGWMSAWEDAAGLWVGVGNAALQAAKTTVVRNEARLARKRG